MWELKAFKLGFDHFLNLKSTNMKLKEKKKNDEDILDRLQSGKGSWFTSSKGKDKDIHNLHTSLPLVTQ